MRKTTGTAAMPSRRQALATRSRDDCWHAETSADGVRTVALAGALDANAAQELLRELSDDRWQRLIVDLRMSEPLADHTPGLLAGVFMERVPRAAIVVVAARGSALERLLPRSIPVAFSLEDARRLLSLRARRRDLHGQVRPDRDVISAANRHALAVRQALRWAAQAAAAGEFESALRALDTIERVDGALPAEWIERRQAWQAERAD
jgi:hypothetical protein